MSAARSKAEHEKGLRCYTLFFGGTVIRFLVAPGWSASIGDAEGGHGA